MAEFPPDMGDLMTTDQIKRTDAGSGAAEVDDAGPPPVDIDAAREEAKDIVAKARYDAFRMVTDARNEAEAILQEAETARVTPPDPTSPPDITAAELDALEERRAELLTEIEWLIVVQARLEGRIDSTRNLLHGLEERLARIAARPTSASRQGTADPSPAGTAGPTDIDVRTDDAAPVPPAASTTMDYSPSVPHPRRQADVEPAPPESGDTEFGSYYSRRSARLPSIGNKGGQSALSAVSSIRSRITD